MGQFYTEIPPFLLPWIHQQKIFFVATAPLSPTGHVNVSPKGFEGSFRVVNEKRVWYEDLTGSGIETIAHLRENLNGRITIMFVAFEGPPRIVRLFGTGTVHEFGTPEYEALIPSETREPGSRAAIVIDIHKVGSSCGYSIPFFDFKSHRMRLHTSMAKKEAEDTKASTPSTPPSLRTDKGLKAYWNNKNSQSIDGLPGLATALSSPMPFAPRVIGWGEDDERVGAENANASIGLVTAALKGVGMFRIPVQWQGLLLGFLLGVVVMRVWGGLGGGRAVGRGWPESKFRLGW
ncbi:hypothetical protein B0H34DRAFT_752830 [Crassisporium funariophilum]|nr:hypothetical protein B0H34DRAFT_752830 [Crassisporium funariophilum]